MAIDWERYYQESSTHSEDAHRESERITPLILTPRLQCEDSCLIMWKVSLIVHKSLSEPLCLNTIGEG